MNVPHILGQGAAWYRQWGTEKSAGTKIFSVSGPVKRPGNYELPLGVPLRVLLEEHCGGMRDGLKLKAVIPGGSSVPPLPASLLDTPLDFESMNAAGTLLGSGGVIVIDEQTCMVDSLWNLMRFYAHESCGKCTPCREGTYWMTEILERLEHGQGRAARHRPARGPGGQHPGPLLLPARRRRGHAGPGLPQALPRGVRVPRRAEALPGEPAPRRRGTEVPA